MSKELILLGILGALGIGFQIHSLSSGPPVASSSAKAISFRLLGQTKFGDGIDPIFPEELKALDGKTTTISGFAAPFDDPQDLSKLLLTPTGGGCYFCAVPNLGGVVLVKCLSKSMTWWGGGPATFEGVLCLAQPNTADVDARQFLFTLDDARIVQNNF